MSRNNRLVSAVSLFVALCPVLVSAQNLPPAQGRRPGRHQSCAEKAGISRDVIHKRKALEQEAHSQIRSVCADSSLSDKQRRERIKQIHQNLHEQVQSLMTPEQFEALKACQREQHPGGGHAGARAGGPCAAP